jgi:hypothetical protein
MPQFILARDGDGVEGLLNLRHVIVFFADASAPERTVAKVMLEGDEVEFMIPATLAAVAAAVGVAGAVAPASAPRAAQVRAKKARGGARGTRRG